MKRFARLLPMLIAVGAMAGLVAGVVLILDTMYAAVGRW